MSDEKKYTERDMVMAKRNAYYGALTRVHWVVPDEARSMAKLAFPMPKKVVPRAVKAETGWSYKLEGGNLWFHNPLEEDWHALLCGKSLVAIIDVIRNPTEEVEDD